MEVKYDRIGAEYNATRKADPYLTERLYALLSPKAEGIYLDIGCGTGNYTHALHQRGIRFIGIDPSENMLGEAKTKNPSIRWKVGRAEATGLEEESMDGIIGSLTIHHWEDLELGFAELYRVLKPGGKLVIFTSTPAQMQGYWLNHYFPKMLAASMKQMPSLNAVKQGLTSAGFAKPQTETYAIQPDLQDLFLYSGKQNPALYFNAAVRKGISSFSDLAHQEEVETGLIKLAEDMKSDRIGEIIRSYENEGGDYLYLIAQKESA